MVRRALISCDLDKLAHLSSKKSILCFEKLATSQEVLFCVHLWRTGNLSMTAGLLAPQSCEVLNTQGSIARTQQCIQRFDF